jgi:lipopolysaccharide export LptBFGC system permease protein LptF
MSGPIAAYVTFVIVAFGFFMADDADGGIAFIMALLWPVMLLIAVGYVLRTKLDL